MRNRDDGWKAALGKVGPQSHRRLAARCRPSAPSRGWPVSGSWHWVVNDCNWGGSRLAAFSVCRRHRERLKLGGKRPVRSWVACGNIGRSICRPLRLLCQSKYS